MIINPTLYQQGTKLPELSNPGTAADLLAGKQLVDQYGNPLTGTMPQRSAADLTASGAAVTVPAGYYPSQVSKSVATATHPKPTISRSGGTITAKHVQSAGYTSGGTTTETLSIPTQAAKTVTPTTYAQTAVSSGRLTTGAVTVAGDANLKAENIKSGVSIFGIMGSLVSTPKFEVRVENNTSGYVDFSEILEFDGVKTIMYGSLSSGEIKYIHMQEGILLLSCSVSRPNFELSNNVVKNKSMLGDYYAFAISGNCTIEVT